MKAARIIAFVLCAAVPVSSYACNGSGNCNRPDHPDETKPRGASAKKGKQADKGLTIAARGKQAETTETAAQVRARCTDSNHNCNQPEEMTPRGVSAKKGKQAGKGQTIAARGKKADATETTAQVRARCHDSNNC